MRNRSTQNNSTLSSQVPTKKAMIVAERSSAEKQTSRIDNSNLHSQKRTSLSKKDEISTPKAKVTQNRKATSDVNRSIKSVDKKGETYTERINQKEVKSGADKVRTSNVDLASNSRKPVYTKKSSERKNVVSESKSRSAASNQKSYASNSRSKSQQNTSKSQSSPGNKIDRSNTRNK
jgi:hypothetical protein